MDLQTERSQDKSRTVGLQHLMKIVCDVYTITCYKL